MRLLVGERGSGRTTHMVQWVTDGHATERYPYWSRTLIVMSRAEADRLRKQILPVLFGLPVGHKDAPDYYRMVFAYDELPKAGAGLSHELEVGIDNADNLLARLLRVNADVMTLSAEVEFLAKEEER